MDLERIESAVREILCAIGEDPKREGLLKTPSRVARIVMQRTDHVMIVGEGALRFARAHGFKEDNLLTEKARKIWLRWNHPENLLAQHGQISAVIDFGLLAVGDPACDAMVAWWLFTAESRETFRAALRVDDDTWARGRGWALSVGVRALAYYLDNNPVLARMSRRTVDEALADHRHTG